MVIATEVACAHLQRMAQRPEDLIPANVAAEMRPERIGYRMKLLRKAHNLERAQISDMLGIERTYWSRFENGKRVVSDAVAALLVDRFDVTLDFLLLGRWNKLPVELANKMREAEDRLMKEAQNN